MCGIFAVASFGVPLSVEQLIEFLINGLRRLEYRGYDSAGVSFMQSGKTFILRETGNVQALHDSVFQSPPADLDLKEAPLRSPMVGVAHTRWATHGPPCVRNAHPHSSGAPDHDFVVTHNGIMTNYKEIKTFLESKGQVFLSDTDTEVIAALAKYLYAMELKQAPGEPVTFAKVVLEVMRLVNGASAVTFTSRHFPGELVVTKRGSPLIIGIKRGDKQIVVGDPLQSIRDGPYQIFVASDTSPIAEHTKKVVYLDDDDVVSISEGSVKFFNLNRSTESAMLAEVRAVKELELELEALSKGAYPHFMLKEIHEQVETVMGSMRGRVNWESGAVALGGFMPNRRMINNARRIVFISCGTSLNACMAVRPLFEQLVDVPVSVENASDFLDRAPRMFRDDVCVVVSQSGETADTLRAMEHCRGFGAVLVGFTNTVGSAISRHTDFGAHLNCGPEIGVASTKAFTSQIVAMTLLALVLCEDSKAAAPRRAEILRGLHELPTMIAECIRQTADVVKDVAARMLDAKSVLVLGRGYQYAIALEAALKIKELTYIHTEGINAGELKHGPLALIDEHITCIILCTKDAVIERVRAAVQQIRARGGRPIVMLSAPDPEVEDLADTVIRVPQAVDCLQSIINVIPLQLLAYHTAVLRGNNVDCPRNLAKSVTVQ
jgi:glucosamine--fructose-6-phosphate aminotransferase (isomerizing)